MSWPDLLCHIFLSTVHESVLLPLLVGGILWGDRRLFFSAVNLLLLGMLLAAALKAYFQVPLAPHLHKNGFAFPSGHMLAATALYGGLLVMTPYKWLRWTLAVNLAGFAYALVAQGYHNINDVTAAVWFASALVGTVHTVQHRISATCFLIGSAGFASVCVISCACFHQVPAHAWMAYGLLCGFLAGNAPVPSLPLPPFNKANRPPWFLAYSIWLAIGLLLIISPLSTTLLTVCGWSMLGSALPLTTWLLDSHQHPLYAK